MTVRTKPSIGEALSPWADPVDAVMLLNGFLNAVNETAAKVGCTELEGWQIIRPLGLSHVAQLAQLRSKGLLVRYRDGRYWVDIRDFARWISQECDRLRQLPRNERTVPPVQSQGMLGF